ncbi:MAG: hypothetical protein H0X12_15145 [Nocardioides sp.]|nr:hypothetical protein [Nocardioides sp.]
MPDLQPMYDELHPRLSDREDAFVASHNFSGANAAGGRTYAERGWLAR